MKRFKLLSAVLAAAALIAGCDKNSGSAADAQSASQPAQAAPSIETIQAEGQGFTVGSTMSVRTVYVFFDAQCPHCGALWYASRPLRSQAKFVWMPVRLLNDASESQGATLLAAKDPAAAMDEHEALLMDKKGGISAASGIDAQREAVRKNTELFNRFGFASVPSMVMKHPQSGAVVTREGSMPTAELAAFLGVSVPSGQ